MIEAQHPLPESTRKWGYDHCPNVYKAEDPHAMAFTGAGTVECGLIRLVGGCDPRKGRFSRGPDSWISLDTYSIGWAHFWAETAAKLLERIATDNPELSVWAWGDDGYRLVRDADRLLRYTGDKRGKTPHVASLDWLLAGWYAVARHPDVMRSHVAHWLDRYVPGALAYLRRKRWKEARTLAGLVRVNNSGGMSRRFDAAIRSIGDDDELAVLRKVFCDEDLYDKPDRYEKIMAWPEFKGRISDDWTHSALRFDYSATIVRTDGSVPTFPDSLPAVPERPATPVPAWTPPAGYPTLRKGAQGSDVEDLQEGLNLVGASLRVDGDFGPATDGAVRTFQGRNGLEVDGIVGRKTWGALSSAVSHL